MTTSILKCHITTLARCEATCSTRATGSTNWKCLQRLMRTMAFRRCILATKPVFRGTGTRYAPIGSRDEGRSPQPLTRYFWHYSQPRHHHKPLVTKRPLKSATHHSLPWQPEPRKQPDHSLETPSGYSSYWFHLRDPTYIDCQA